MKQLQTSHTPRGPYGLLLIGMLASLPAYYELGGALPLPRDMYLGYGAICAALLWLCNDFRLDRRLLANMAVLAVTLGSLHMAPWTPRKAFIAKFNHVEPGMTVADVRALLGPYAVREHRSDPAHGELMYRHDKGRYDSDVGVVTVRAGRVVETKLSWD